MEGDREAAKHMDVLDSADAEEKEVAQALTGAFFSFWHRIRSFRHHFCQILVSNS